MKPVRLITLGFVGILLGACTSLGLFAVNAPTHFDDVKVVRDVAFGSQDWEKLDIYLPPAPLTHHDVIVFYYGGRWETGEKAQYRFVGTALAKRGFVVVIPDYRKYPQVRFPQFVHDAAASLAWTARHAGQFGGDAARIHLAGHSAGAHIASLLAVDPSYLRAEGLERSAVIRDFAGLSGPYAFTPTDADLIAMFGPPDRYPRMQATTFIDGTQPPMLLLWGDKDQYVGRINIDKVVAAVHAKGGCAGTKIYPGVDHIKIVSAFSWLGGPPVADDLTAFFTRTDACGTP